MVKTLLPLQAAWVQSPVGEVPHAVRFGQKIKNEKIKTQTAKMTHGGQCDLLGLMLPRIGPGFQVSSFQCIVHSTKE